MVFTGEKEGDTTDDSRRMISKQAHRHVRHSLLASRDQLKGRREQYKRAVELAPELPPCANHLHACERHIHADMSADHCEEQIFKPRWRTDK